jgi:fibro-slime domain-containing protein
VRLPAVFRDFNGRGSAGAHPDFQPGYAAAGALQGLVQPELDAEGKPSLAAAATATNGYLHGQAAFAQWYRDVSGVNARVAGEIVLWGDGSGRYVNRWGASGEPWLAYSNITWCGSTDCAACGPPPEGQMCAAPCPNSLFGPVCFATKVLYDGNPLFFPVDSAPGILSELRIAAQVPEQYGFMGWPTEASVATALGQTTPVATATAPFPSATHNFSFTTEVRVWFRYDATRPARIEINGDDDIWAFLNGHLAIDLGGWHVPLDGSVALDGGTITSSATLTLGFSPVTTVKSAAAFGLEHGRVYSLAVFHAERQTSGSALRVAVSGLDLLQGPCSP